jgi:hypothetical protein
MTFSLSLLSFQIAPSSSSYGVPVFAALASPSNLETAVVLPAFVFAVIAVRIPVAGSVVVSDVVRDHVLSVIPVYLDEPDGLGHWPVARSIWMQRQPRPPPLDAQSPRSVKQHRLGGSLSLDFMTILLVIQVSNPSRSVRHSDAD